MILDRNCHDANHVWQENKWKSLEKNKREWALLTHRRRSELQITFNTIQCGTSVLFCGLTSPSMVYETVDE